MDIDSGYPWPMQGARWTAYDYRIIIEGLQRGQTWAEIARVVGRTVSAVQNRASILIENEDGGRRRKAWQRLQDRIEIEPDHDWETIARRKHAEAELPYWDENADAHVRTVWAAAPTAVWRGRGWLRRSLEPGVGMAELSAALRMSDADISDRIVILGLSTSYAEIVDRLGCTPGGSLEQRANLARADDQSSQYVLVAAGELGDILHVSLHADREAAEYARVVVESRFGRQGPVSTRIVRRVPGRLFDEYPNDDQHSRSAVHTAKDLDIPRDTVVAPAQVVDLDEETEPPPSSAPFNPWDWDIDSATGALPAYMRRPPPRRSK
ncbi:hypothetical protein [Nocardia sp. NPDC051750]|uniref:hypothetical protein n=1 Tax=Nocardia sp. NPDC051750 TaxID=3364325 RepID=UPI0037AA6EF9